MTTTVGVSPAGQPSPSWVNSASASVSPLPVTADHTTSASSNPSGMFYIRGGHIARPSVFDAICCLVPRTGTSKPRGAGGSNGLPMGAVIGIAVAGFALFTALTLYVVKRYRLCLRLRRSEPAVPSGDATPYIPLSSMA